MNARSPFGTPLPVDIPTSSLSPDIWPRVVGDVTNRAKAALPETVGGLITRAKALVLTGSVTLLPDGSARVLSTTYPETAFSVNGHCTCEDAKRMEFEGWCEHRIAAAIAKRAHESVVIPHPLPEAPASANVYITIAGHKVQVTLRDHHEDVLLARMEYLLARFPNEETPIPTTSGDDWCAIHRAGMKERQGPSGSWFSHQTEDGWCSGKLKNVQSR